jgi:hypothetical protein
MIIDNKHPDAIYVFIICISLNYTGSKSENKESPVLLCIHCNSNDQSPSWYATGFSASQEIPHFMELKIHYRIHNSPTLISILGPINVVHALATDLFALHFNIILQSTTMSSKTFYILCLRNGS